MSIQVESAYLRAYADRIEANCDGALAQMAAYVQAHCLDFEGLDGALAPVRRGLQPVAEATADLIAAAQSGLRHTAEALRRSADDYDRSDLEAAETQWTVAPEWTTPFDWKERDVHVTEGSGGGPGATVILMAPPYKPEVEEATDYLKSLLKSVNTIIEKLTGYDLLGAVLPLLLGDWGALKRIARAYGQLETAWREVARDIGAGMDELSEHWTSGGVTGGASQAFDYHIRHRWMNAFEALAQHADTMEQANESLAAEYEHTVKGVFFTLNYFLAGIKKNLGKLMVATSWKKMAMALYSIVSAVYDLIVDGISLAVEQVQMFVEGFQMAAAGFVMLRHQMNDDFDALKTR